MGERKMYHKIIRHFVCLKKKIRKKNATNLVKTNKTVGIWANNKTHNFHVLFEERYNLDLKGRVAGT